ncbi:MAG: hypothetical protein JXR58_04140 [Bacteroidales bacterium]|nr:hypothetical protein [Bacteroidales bacterium]
MKKIIAVLLVFMSVLSFSQEVQDIVTTQNGEKIDVSFKVSNSNSKQVFNVTLFCAIDGKEKIELKSVSGDVGSNIAGGKDSYKITWDVLKDVDELNSAEFFVKIVLAKDDSKLKVEKPVKEVQSEKAHPWYVGYNGSTFLGFGLRAGYLGKYGGYVSFRSGTRWANEDRYYYNNYKYASQENYDAGISDSYESVFLGTGNGQSGYDGTSLVFGGSYRFLNKNLELWAFAGIGLGTWSTMYKYNITDTDEYWVEDDSHELSFYNTTLASTGYYEKVEYETREQKLTSGVEWEVGCFISYKRITANIGSALCYGDLDFVFGLGYRF